MQRSSYASPHEPNSQMAYLYLLTTMAFFGSAFASSKMVVGELPHQVAAVLRFGGGALILILAMLMIRTRRPKITRANVFRAGLLGLLGVFGYNFFFFWGLSLAPSLDGAIIVPVMSPVLTTIFLVATKKETASPVRIAGLIIAVIGATLFFVSVGGAETTLTGSRLAGDLVFLLGAVSWAAYTIISKKVLTGVEPFQATTIGTAVGALALLLISIPSIPDVNWTSVSGLGWANVIYLAIGPTALAYLFYYRGLKTVAPSTATIMMFAVPIFGTLCATLFLGESFTKGQLLGALITIAGALLAVTQGNLGKRHEQPHAELKPDDASLNQRYPIQK
ncbi:DMT family transporter [Rhodococcus sp. NPDC058521]|uniref:DMT family transporter n=1 Tax=Rhodococcus sp. NPDC058521 TaxID=3346536 RepID=UPI00365F3E46